MSKSKTGKWVDFKEVKEKVSIVNILSHYGLLDRFKNKNGALTGACPIHKGTNPTQFNVSLAKNVWHCFGNCHKGGNILDFVAEMEKVSLREAALMIQDWFAINPKKPANTKSEKSPKNQKADQQTPTEKTAEADTLTKEKEPINKPLTFTLKHLDPEHLYLKQRGLDKETIKAFGLGFCKKGLMKGRVAIPIHNKKDELVAYAGRWPGDPPEGKPKYKLPAGFHKSLVVFNIHKSKDIAKEKGLILVEGFFDCFKVWQAGFKNVAALMGSSLSEEQESQILEAAGPCGRIALMFDEDEAGWACRKEALERLSQKAYVRVIKLGEAGLQPDLLSEEKIKELLS